MTRKRYIKLCMSRGYSRNEAQALASLVRSEGLSYADAFDEDCATAGAVLPSFEDFARAVQELAAAAQIVAEAIAEGMAAFVYAFTAAMNRLRN